MRVLVCGGRSYGAFGNNPPGSLRYAEAFAERGIMCRALDDARSEGMQVIIEGGASGADAYAARYAANHGVSKETFKADWHNAGRAAGPLRNQRMIDEGRPDLVLAFPGGCGTADMIWRAKAAGVEVREVAPSPAMSHGAGGAS